MKVRSTNLIVFAPISQSRNISPFTLSAIIIQKITEKARADFKEATKRILENPNGENYVKVIVDGIEVYAVENVLQVTETIE